MLEAINGQLVYCGLRCGQITAGDCCMLEGKLKREEACPKRSDSSSSKASLNPAYHIEASHSISMEVARYELDKDALSVKNNFQ